MSDTQTLRVDGVRFWTRRDPHAEAVLRAALAAADDPAVAIKTGRRKALFAFAHEGVDYLVKTNRYGRGPRAWFRASKARREWTRAQRVASRGIATPALFAAGEQREVWGPLRRCWTVVPRMPDARDLASWVRETRPGVTDRWRVARGLGEVVAALHEAGLHQEDLAPNNFLIDSRGDEQSGPRLLAIDFERLRVRRGPIRSGERVASLAKLHRYLYDAPSGLWWRFLRSYCGEDTGAARALARAIAEETRALFSRDRAHLERRASATNRRFRPTLGRGGWAHRAISDAEIETALASSGDTAHWQTELRFKSRADAGRWWALAQTLAQRGGLIARPLALAQTGPDAWRALSERRAGEREGVSVAAHAVVRRRVEALGLPPPAPEELLACPDAPGARLRVPPGSPLRGGV